MMLLETTLKQKYIQYNEEYYKQEDGIASAIIAIDKSVSDCTDL
jgi:hypothetical protein